MKTAIIILLLFVSVICQSQSGVKIQDLVTHSGNTTGGYIPMTLSGATLKVGTNMIGVWDVYTRNDSLFKSRFGQEIFVVKTNQGGVPTTRMINNGTGIGGGGDLDDDITLYLYSIAGFIQAGTNVSITGTGTISSPYVINSTGGGGGGGGSYTFNSPLTSDGSFVSIPLATNIQNGYLSAADREAFAAKLSNITGLIQAGSNISLTGSGTAVSPYVINSAGTRPKTVQLLTDGSTITMDVNTGNHGSVTLAGNRTLVLSNLANGDEGWIKVKQDATGGRLLFLPASSEVGAGFGGGTSITLSTGPNKKDQLFFTYDGVNISWSIIKDLQ